MIQCCKCNKTYQFLPHEDIEGHLVIVCPHCGFRHSVDFKPIIGKGYLKRVDKLKLTHTTPPILIASRIFDDTWVAEANDDIDVIDWDETDEFIIGFQLDEEAGAWNAQYKIRWRDVTDGGSFADLASSGECKFGSATSLVNGSPVTARKLQATGGSGSSWQNGEQVEGASTCDSINLADEYYTEVHFAVSVADAQAGHEYEFEIYDATNGASVDTAACTLKIKANQPPTVALNTPAPAAEISDTTPTLEFTGTDPDGNDIRYNIQIDTVNTFDSQAGDISDASYVSDDYTVTTGENTVYGVWFNPAGTKMFVLGATLEDVLRYSLSPAWDVSSATLDSGQTLDTTSIDTSPRGFAMSADGMNIYICGNSNNKIFQWKLTTAWDLTTASFTTGDEVASEDATPRDIHFNSDGTKMILVGGNSVKAYRYTLSTAWDITTASYDTGQYFDLSGSLGAPTGVWLNSAGTKMYVADDDSGGTTWYIKQYTLSTAWDLTTASYDSKSLNITTNTPECSGLFFQPDNSHLYIAATDDHRITKYAMGGSPLLDKVSGTDVGFANVTTPADDEPYNSGNKCDYDVQAGDALSETTYYWRVKGIDPTGSNTYGAWSSIRSFTITTGATQKNVTDSGSGSDTIAGLLNTLALSETGSGAEVASILSAFLTSDNGAGSETADVLIPLTLTDAGSGAEIINLLSKLTIADSGTASEIINILTEISLSDSGSANDAVNILVSLALTDTGAGSDAVQAVIAILLQDNGTGVDVLEILGKIQISEESSGSDAVYLKLFKSISDSANGTDTLSVLAKMAVSDLGSGADVISVLMAIATTDSGAGVDAVESLAQLVISDTGNANEVIDILSQIAVSETGVGAEAVLIFTTKLVQDSGSGAEIASVLSKLTISDAGIGSEIISVLSQILQTDTGQGTEVLEMLGQIALSDSGSGVDEVSKQVQGDLKQVSDSGAGSEALNILTQLALTDTGIGTEAINLLIELTISDTGVGQEALEALIQLAISDSGAGSEVINILVQLAISDTGSASEALSVLFKIATSDSGVGSEVISILNELIIAESGSGTEVLSILTKLALIDTAVGTEAVNILSQMAIQDSGAGAEILSILSKITATDTGTGTEALSILNQLMITDTGTGVEALELIIKLALSDAGIGSETLSNLIDVVDSATGNTIITIFKYKPFGKKAIVLITTRNKTAFGVADKKAILQGNKKAITKMLVERDKTTLRNNKKITLLNF